MIRGLVFDCFGVLQISPTQHFFERYPQHKNELHDLNLQADYGMIDRRDYIVRVAEITGLSFRDVEQAILQEVVPNTQLLSFIKAELKPTFKVALLSNVGRGWLDDFFTKEDLHDLFDAVVLSSEIGIIKPDERAYVIAADRLGLPPDECIMIDDRLDNCHGADRAGMKWIQYQELRQLEQDLASSIS